MRVGTKKCILTSSCHIRFTDAFTELNCIYYRPSVNFTNILQAAFAHKYTKSAKRHRLLGSLFALLGSGHVKAVHKYVGEIDPLCWFHRHFMSRLEIGKKLLVKLSEIDCSITALKKTNCDLKIINNYKH